MEELREGDIRLINDPKELRKVIAVLKRDVLRLESLYREENQELLKKRQRESYEKRRLGLENGEQPVDTAVTRLNGLMAIKSRLEAESKVMQQMKPSTTGNATIVSLNLEKELKETTENFRTLIEVAEEEKVELNATLKRLDVVIDRDMQIAEALRGKIREKLQELTTNVDERTRHRVQMLKNNIRKVKSSTVKTWDKLGEFLDIHFPSVPRNGHMRNSPRNQENGLPIDEYVKMSDMIQQLMNAHASKIDNSYLKISNTWYPPYVKMLLGRGICLQDLQRPDHIRLETYL